MADLFIITGKGGVGKTSVAAAHAVRSSEEGRRTLLVSADMAHNLGDIFQVQAGGHVEEIGPGLSLLELDPYMLMREEYPNVNRAIASLSQGAGAAWDKVGDSYMIPGFENLFCLLKIRDLYRSGSYDRIVVDCAPTGETLSLLKLPELLTWYVEKFSPVGRMLTRILTPAAKIRYRMDLPDGAAMDELGRLFRDLVELQDLLKDPETCRVRLVCIPERMVVEETRRAYMYLNLYGYPVDAVFINRVLPPDAGSGFMDRWRQIQTGYLAELESIFVEIPTVQIPWYPREVRGPEAVQRLGRDMEAALQNRLRDGREPDLQGEVGKGIPPHVRENNQQNPPGSTGQRADLFHLPVRTDVEVYEKTPEGYRLRVRLPGGDQEKVQISLHGTDLDIRIRNFQRSIPLPGVLRGAVIRSHEITDGRLIVEFLAQKQPPVSSQT